MSLVVVSPGIAGSSEWTAPANAASVVVSLRVQEPPGASVNEPLGSIRLAAGDSGSTAGSGHVAVRLGPGMDVSVGSKTHPVTIRVPLIAPPHFAVPLVLTVGWYDNSATVLFEQATEVRVFASDRLVRGIEALAARTQVSRDALPMMSIARYFGPLLPWVPFIRGADVLVSGCGTGGELLAVMALGARHAIGVERAGAELDLASDVIRHAEGAEVLAYAEGLPGVPECDVALSRHVIEHVPVPQRGKYVVELLRRVRPGGRLLLEAPNQNCPIEPHTAVRFFHWLSDDQQERAIGYLRARSAAVPADRAEADLLTHLRGTETRCFRRSLRRSAVSGSSRRFRTSIAPLSCPRISLAAQTRSASSCVVPDTPVLLD